MVNPRQKILVGEQTHFFEKIVVDDTEFPESSQIWIRIKYINNIRLTLEASTAVEYSFNGTHVHGDMTTSTVTADITFTNIHDSKIWFKVASGSTTVRVEAW